MRPVLDRARAGAATVHLDTEHDEAKDLGYELLRRLGRDHPDVQLGCVVQAYRKDSYADLHDLVAWSATDLHVPLRIRLVKGAYWDHEEIVANVGGLAVAGVRAQGRDRRQLRALHAVPARPPRRGAGRVREPQPALPRLRGRVRRSGAASPTRRRAADAVRHGRADAGRARPRWASALRVYAPVGELVPGMAYLVRRLLENTSNESFVRHRFAEGRDLDELVARAGRSTSVDSTSRRAAPLRPATDPAAPAPFTNEPVAELRRAGAACRAHAVAVARCRRIELGFVGARRSSTAQRGRDRPRRSSRSIPAASTASCAGVAGADRRASTPRSTSPRPRGRRGGARRGRSGPRCCSGRRDGCGPRRAELAALEVLRGRQAVGRGRRRRVRGDRLLRVLRPRGAPPRRGGARRRTGRPARPTVSLPAARASASVIAPWNFPLAIPTGMIDRRARHRQRRDVQAGRADARHRLRLVEVLARGRRAAGRARASCPAPARTSAPASSSTRRGVHRRSPAPRRSAWRSTRRRRRSDPGSARSSGSSPRWAARTRSSSTPTPTSTRRSRRSCTARSAYAGQKCSAASRVIVLDRVYDELVDRLAGAAAVVRGGPAQDLRTVCGPLIDADALRARCAAISRWRTRRATSSSSVRRRPPAAGTSGRCSPSPMTPVRRSRPTRSSGRCSPCCAPGTSTTRSPSPTTPTTRSPPACSPARRHGSPMRRARSGPATCTSTGASPARVVGRQPFGGFGAVRRGLQGGWARLPAAVRRAPRGHREHHPPGLRTATRRGRGDASGVTAGSVLDRRVGPRKEQRFVTVDAPADEPWWRATVAADVDDLTPPLGLTDVTAPDDDPVTDSCLHGDHLLDDALEVPSLSNVCSTPLGPRNGQGRGRSVASAGSRCRRGARTTELRVRSTRSSSRICSSASSSSATVPVRRCTSASGSPLTM